MQIIRECRMRAVILTEIAKDAPEFENQYNRENCLTGISQSGTDECRK
jgi:hypothetical protein